MKNYTNKNSYNKIAQKWAISRHSSFVSKLVADFADKLNPNANLLDIGCGTGRPLTKYLCERKFNVTGIDVSEKMVEIAKSEKIPNAEFVTCDFFDFHSTEKFDGILAWDSFFHFPKERQEEIYIKVGSILNSNGYLLFTHGDVDDEHFDKMMGESFYYSCLPKEKVSQILIDNGFEIEYVYKDYLENDTHRGLVVLAKRR
jgi:2-polyprenyl-3-methyl-5-hydroxy-6-metoxy-1,4-benzoquinol methylase